MPVEFYTNNVTFTTSTAGTAYYSFGNNDNYYYYPMEPEINMVKGSVVGPNLQLQEEEDDEPALWDQI